jgi:hypothetical protein
MSNGRASQPTKHFFRKSQDSLGVCWEGSCRCGAYQRSVCPPSVKLYRTSLPTYYQVGRLLFLFVIEASIFRRFGGSSAFVIFGSVTKGENDALAAQRRTFFGTAEYSLKSQNVSLVGFWSFPLTA